MNADEEALARLLAYVEDALAKQDPHVQDQLRAALREGKTSVRFERSVAGPVVVVTVDGYELAEVPVRHLVEQ